ncbi:hypothetical protein AVEN_271494-1 [Araneus ventricosus]|uniref:Uncharacterized protein n=1 Tax=Araneus ventricosus TaxID=182803 RepID=A0A4Y2DCF5_ARAVE|nr:hypothetical protein AVEN_271494-1 [Araneus ventricosus]
MQISRTRGSKSLISQFNILRINSSFQKNLKEWLQLRDLTLTYLAKEHVLFNLPKILPDTTRVWTINFNYTSGQLFSVESTDFSVEHQKSQKMQGRPIPLKSEWEATRSRFMQ